MRLQLLLQEKGYIRGPFGSALVRSELKKEGIPVYEQDNAINDNRLFRYFIDDNKYQELKRFTVQKNDLIISCSGNVGRITLIKENDPKGIISQALLLLRPNIEIVNPKYLLYYFRSPVGFFQLTQASHGSVQVNIAPRATVENIDAYLPEKAEQNEIVEILSSLDEKLS